MKTRLLLLICLVCLSVQPAEAGKLKDFGKKAAHVAKKTVLLPVYVAGGAGAGLITWWHIGGRESEFGDALRGGKF